MKIIRYELIGQDNHEIYILRNAFKTYMRGLMNSCFTYYLPVPVTMRAVFKKTLILTNCSFSLLMASLCLVVLMWMDVILCEQTLYCMIYSVCMKLVHILFIILQLGFLPFIDLNF